ncbi:uncharacterized protein LOC143875941 [Tasmannia lanceolata]|uniref:uncharacterized protein LOC143875941 n=1 Tax=Tasmannia lanceolata TaxID=3420 RepID=UPI004062C827
MVNRHLHEYRVEEEEEIDDDHEEEEDNDDDEEEMDTRRKGYKEKWLPAGKYMFPRAKCSSQSIVKYSKHMKPEEVKQFLVNTGWKIEHKVDKYFVRFRYIAPDNGKRYYSLRNAIKALKVEEEDHEEEDGDDADENEDNVSNECWLPVTKFILPKAKCTTHAMKLHKVRQHLLDRGWKIERKEDRISFKFRYFSPDNGKYYYSLRQIPIDLKAEEEDHEEENGDDADENEDTNNPIHTADTTRNGCRLPVGGYILPKAKRSPRKMKVAGKSHIRSRKNSFSKDESICRNSRPMKKIESKEDKDSSNEKYYTFPFGVCRGLKEDEKIHIGSCKSLVCKDEGTVGNSGPMTGSSTKMIVSVGKPVSSILQGGRKKRRVLDRLGDASFDKEFCPQAIVDYCNCELRSSDSKKLVMKAKMHLSFEGWSFWYIKKNGRRELRYSSPMGKTFISLRTACMAWMEEQGNPLSNTTRKSMADMLATKKLEKDLSATMLTEFEECYVPSQLMESELGEEQFGEVGQCGERSHENPTSMFTLQLMEPELGKEQLGEVGQCEERSHENSATMFTEVEECYVPPQLMELELGKEQLGEVGQCEERSHENLEKGKKSHRLDEKGNSQSTTILMPLEDTPACEKVENDLGQARFGGDKKCKKRSKKNMEWGKKSRSPIKQRGSSDTSHLMLVPRSRRRSVLSWMIDNGVVSPTQKVFYKNKNDGTSMAEGEITYEGIKCKCCKKVYALTGFEAHAGSTNHRPSAHIFLEDGRSLSQCQEQIVLYKRKGFEPDPLMQIESDKPCLEDSECSVCHFGGRLVLCDQCPSAFHIKCIGLKGTPMGTWFCPFCQCGICGQGEFDTDAITEKTVFYCDQCQHEYHWGCLRNNRGLEKIEICPQGNWFCSDKCSKIFFSLKKLLGKSQPTDVEGLTWTVLRAGEENSIGLDDTSNIEANTVHHGKLLVAHNILQKCFPAIKKDHIGNVISDKWSKLPRLSFRGFYTILLEREDELISVATVRIYDEKVAEMPLIGTLEQYQQQGMCRLVMNKIEKMLSDLGVERLLLPSVPYLLDMWCNSFGFTKMTSSDRLRFLDYVFWDFQDTSLCQKILMTSPTESIDSKGNKDDIGDCHRTGLG